MAKYLGTGLALFLLAGCAHNPDVTFTYYQATSTVDVSVVQTLTCNDQEEVIVVHSAEFKVKHAVDTGAGAKEEIPLKALDSTFSDTDFAVEYYDDQRLKSINATSTGQGGATIKSGIALLDVAGGLGFLKDDGRQSYPAICDIINAKDPRKNTETMTLKYVGSFPRDLLIQRDRSGKLATMAATKLEPDLTSEANFSRLNGFVGDVLFGGVPVENNPRTLNVPVRLNSASKDGFYDHGIVIPLRQPIHINVAVAATYAGTLEEVAQEFLILAGDEANEYPVPIPRAAFFGKQSFGVALAESGQVTKISYGKTSGVSAALDAVSALGGLGVGSTTAEKAAAVEAEADLIAQQQRLARCEANPDECE